MPRGPVQSELVEHSEEETRKCRHCEARWTGPPGTVILELHRHLKAEHYRAPEVAPVDPWPFHLRARQAVVASGFSFVRETSDGLVQFSRGKEVLHIIPSGWFAFSASGRQVAKGSKMQSLQQYLGEK